MQGMELVKDLEAQSKAIFAQKKLPVAKLSAEKLFAFIYLYQDILPELNAAKEKLDEAYKVGNIEQFDAALKQFKEIAWMLWDAKKAVKSRSKMRNLKILRDLMQETLRKIAFVENTIIGGERWLKEAAMSPAQKAAAQRASVRMSLMWS